MNLIKFYFSIFSTKKSISHKQNYKTITFIYKLSLFLVKIKKRKRKRKLTRWEWEISLPTFSLSSLVLSILRRGDKKNSYNWGGVEMWWHTYLQYIGRHTINLHKGLRVETSEWYSFMLCSIINLKDTSCCWLWLWFLNG